MKEDPNDQERKWLLSYEYFFRNQKSLECVVEAYGGFEQGSVSRRGAGLLQAETAESAGPEDR